MVVSNSIREFFKHLKQRGLSDRSLESQLGLTTHNPNRMTAEDVSKLAAFTYHNHPDIFQGVLADQPAMLKFLSNPMVGAVLVPIQVYEPVTEFRNLQLIALFSVRTGERFLQPSLVSGKRSDAFFEPLPEEELQKWE
jgi:hypothetical protein